MIRYYFKVSQKKRPEVLKIKDQKCFFIYHSSLILGTVCIYFKCDSLSLSHNSDWFFVCRLLVSPINYWQTAAIIETPVTAAESLCYYYYYYTFISIAQTLKRWNMCAMSPPPKLKYKIYHRKQMLIFLWWEFHTSNIKISPAPRLNRKIWKLIGLQDLDAFSVEL